MPWHAQTPYLSPREKVYPMAAERLSLHHTPVTILDEHRNLVEAPWAVVYAIQSLYNQLLLLPEMVLDTDF